MFERYAIYYTAQGVFASRGAAWLGWDVDHARPVTSPSLNGLDLARLTETPRKYGFHGTLKPPFRLATGMDETALKQSTESLAQSLHRVATFGLKVAALGRFLALVPQEENTALCAMAGEVVRRLDPFRAPMSATERSRRSAGPLSAAQLKNLDQWGYPYVMDQFRFHMTLTQQLPRDDLSIAQRAAETHFADALPTPFVLDALTLVGERNDGMFVTIKRYALA